MAKMHRWSNSRKRRFIKRRAGQWAREIVERIAVNSEGIGLDQTLAVGGLSQREQLTAELEVVIFEEWKSLQKDVWSGFNEGKWKDWMNMKVPFEVKDTTASKVL